MTTDSTRPTPEQQIPAPSLEELFESFEAVERQRDVVGDAIDPVLDQIRDRIAAQAPPEPSEDQRRIATSWMSVVETSEALGLEAPVPTAEIQGAQSAIIRYESVMSRIGSFALSPESSSVTTAIETAATPEGVEGLNVQGVSIPVPAEIVATPPQVVEAIDKPLSDSTTNRAESSPEFDAEKVLKITYRDKLFAPKPSIRGMYYKVLSTLADAPESTIGTTQFLRDLTGLSSREVTHMESGNIALDPSINLREVKRVHAQFYSVIKTLRRRGYIEHEAGTVSGYGNSKTVSGTVKAHGAITFHESEDGMQIELQPKPYKVTIDEYRQTIGNGEGKVVELERDVESFARLSRIIGVVAARSTIEQARFGRSDLEGWIKAINPNEELTNTTYSKLQDDIRVITSRLDGDFPLGKPDNVSGSPYYTWEEGASVEILDGWPEKPRFDDEIEVHIGDNIVTARFTDSKGEIREEVLVDYANFTDPNSTDTTEDRIEDLMLRNLLVFAELAKMGPRDVVDYDKLALTVFDGEYSVKDRQRLAKWFRTVIQKMNNLDEEPVINKRNRNDVRLLDLNRSIQVVGGQEPTNQLPADDKPAGVINSTDTPAKSPEELANGPVAPVSSAEQLIARATQLTPQERATIQGRLLQNGRFNYPKRIEEAVYLLQLISNSKLTAELRESGRFHSVSHSDFNDFLTNVLTVCYTRTISWGNFDSLYGAVVKAQEADPTEFVHSFVDSVSRSGWQSSVQGEHVQSIKVRSNRDSLEQFNQRALQGLIDGYVTPIQTSIQAINMLDLLRENRELIVAGKTQQEYDILVEQLHERVGEVLGSGNLATALQAREIGRAHDGSRAVQTSTGREAVLGRTDKHRFPEATTRATSPSRAHRSRRK